MVVTLRFLFMTDRVVKRMPLAVRVLLLFAGAFGTILGCVMLWDWFPADAPRAWVAFLVSFGVSCGVSTLLSTLKEKQENKKLEEALRRRKEEQ